MSSEEERRLFCGRSLPPLPPPGQVCRSHRSVHSSVVVGADGNNDWTDGGGGGRATIRVNIVPSQRNTKKRYKRLFRLTLDTAAGPTRSAQPPMNYPRLYERNLFSPPPSIPEEDETEEVDDSHQLRGRLEQPVYLNLNTSRFDLSRLSGDHVVSTFDASDGMYWPDGHLPILTSTHSSIGLYDNLDALGADVNYVANPTLDSNCGPVRESRPSNILSDPLIYDNFIYDRYWFGSGDDLSHYTSRVTTFLSTYSSPDLPPSDGWFRSRVSASR